MIKQSEISSSLIDFDVPVNWRSSPRSHSTASAPGSDYSTDQFSTDMGIEEDTTYSATQSTTHSTSHGTTNSQRSPTSLCSISPVPSGGSTPVARNSIDWSLNSSHSSICDGMLNNYTGARARHSSTSPEQSGTQSHGNKSDSRKRPTIVQDGPTVFL